MRRLSRQYLYTAMYRKYCALSLCVCLLGSDWKCNTTHLFSLLRHTHDKILLRCRCSSLFCFVLVEFASLWLILLHCGCFCFNAGLFFPIFCVTAAAFASSTVDRATLSMYRDYYAGRKQTIMQAENSNHHQTQMAPFPWCSSTSQSDTHDKILLRCGCSFLFCFVLVEFASLWLILHQCWAVFSYLLRHCGCFCFVHSG